MYLDRCSIRVHGKIYTRILLRESYRMMQLRGEIFFSPCRHAKNSFIAMTAIPLSFSACICALNSAGEIARLSCGLSSKR